MSWGPLVESEYVGKLQLAGFDDITIETTGIYDKDDAAEMASSRHKQDVGRARWCHHELIHSGQEAVTGSKHASRRRAIWRSTDHNHQCDALEGNLLRRYPKRQCHADQENVAIES